MWCELAMVPSIRGESADRDHMSLNFMSKRRSPDKCDHRARVRIEIAGMSRSVCEGCGQISVGFVEHHFADERVQEVAMLLGSDASG